MRDTAGHPLPDIKIDVWETDSSGQYDVQHEGAGPDGRGVLRSDAHGVFWFLGITPVSYPIPHDGPVGRLLGRLGRHPYRPAHMHFLLEDDRQTQTRGEAKFDTLITYVPLPPPLTKFPYAGLCPGAKPCRALYLRNDPYETSDAVFGVKDSLVVDVGTAGPEYARRYNVPEDHALLTYDFVLVTEGETRALRERNSRVAMDRLGMKVRMVGGLPVPDLD